ncbi:hypothetical protein [uncultured Desulfobacter sp.]|uniref:hypothetical protein n=1 Tax=uncultured Desulfobacter sp. TaxID=240139 RepID=UPI002AA81BBD|nr:hypothetical protein [uncultured Desulfobacter sp.]
MVQTISVFVAAIALMSVVIECNDSKSDIIKRTNGIYKNIKVIVSDEGVSGMITDDAKAGLFEAEQKYLETVQILESVDLESADGKAALLSIVSCADTTLTVIDTIDVLEEYEPVITAVRVAVDRIKTNIPT